MANPLDTFEYVRSIGKGSYGDVTLARHKRDRKQYVLKKINLKKASSRERKSAEQEAKLLSKLKHPNIVSYKDSFEKEGFLYIAMQFCEGGDLYNKLKEQRGQLLEERQLVEWFVQIAMALQYMHERNILHRDLKTQNIFLTKSKIIKVGDLGIARVLDSSTDMATTLIGTPYYMSPELFSNKPYNHKSDVWALGCCVYEMMTLKHAFNAKDMNSLVYKILRGKMPPMPKQYSTDLVSILRIMLHQDPAKRPTVNRILRDPYIKKNIAIFLEETKQSRRPASAAARSRPGSAQSVTSISSAVSASSVASAPPRMRANYDATDSSALDSDRSSDISSARSSEPDSSRSAVSVSSVEVGSKGEPAKPVPAHRRKASDSKRPDLHPIVEGKMVVDLKEEEEDSGTLKATIKENREGKQPGRGDNKDAKREHMPPPSSSPPRENHAKRKKKSLVSKHPKPVDKPRPLPPPPKMESDGLPQRRDNYDNQPHSTESKSSSSSGSKDDNISLGDETPRSLPNMSAREKRRRSHNAQSYDRPHSARVRLEPPPPSSKSTVVTHSERKRYDAQPAHQRHRQMSIADSSSSDEDTLKESDEGRIHKQKQRPLSHSLTNGDSLVPSHRKHHSPSYRGETGSTHRKHNHHARENKEMNNFIHLLDNTLQLNKEDDKSEEEELQEVKVPVTEETPRIPKSSSMPSVDTLCNADRLMARISLLHEDCIKGVGWPILKEAYEILGRIEEDEVEPKLVSLMGKDKFDLYAGKIWQLKFCEDMARIGIPS